MNNPLATFYSWQVNSGALDGWTSYHIAAGLFIAKVAQWLGCTDFWAVMWVVIIGILWEIFEYFVEGTEETYGTKQKWAIYTASDLFVEIGDCTKLILLIEIDIIGCLKLVQIYAYFLQQSKYDFTSCVWTYKCL